MADTNYEIYKKIRKLSTLLVIFLFFTVLTSGIIQNYSAFGQVGKFGTFSGSNFKYVKDSELFQLKQFSVASWFKTNSTSKIISFIVDKGGTGSEAPGENMNFGMFLNPLGQIQAGFETLDGSNHFVTSQNKLNDDKWHYGTVTYDGSILKLFVDGVLINDKNTTNAEPDYTGKNRITIGANSLFKDKLFIGDLDEVRIWDRALTNAEVYDAFSNNKFNLEGQLVFVSFGDNTLCKQEKQVNVTSIGSQQVHPAVDAIDGDQSTRWSYPGLNSWILLDLGGEKEVCDIDISWYKGDNRKIKFVISASSDGEIFSNIFSETSSGLTDGPERYDLPDIKTRFLKLSIIANSINDWSSISEIDINNPRVPGSPSPCQEVSISPNGVTSIGNQPTHPEQDAFDGDLKTRWSNFGLGSWIDIDLGKEVDICDLGISWYKGDVRKLDFLISVSSDGNDYRQIFSSRSTGDTPELELYDIPDTTAKFVRITVTGNSLNNWSSISEIKIFGKEVQSDSFLSGSQIGVLTKVINNNGGDKQPKDFNISVTGMQAIPNSFSGNPDGQIVSLKPGDYSINVSQSLGYKTIYSAGCVGVVGPGESKDCVITLDDINPPTQPINQTLSVQQKESLQNANNSLQNANNSLQNANNSLQNANNSLQKINNIKSDEKRLISNIPELKVIVEVLNVNGGTKNPSDFTLVVKGENPVPNTFTGNSDLQIVSISPGKYEVKVKDLLGYMINRISGCDGTIETIDKTCIIELIDKPNKTGG